MNIVNITDAEELFVFKHEIEKYLLDSKQIEKKYSPEEFINKYCDISKTIYIKNNIVIPFKLLKLNNKLYLIIAETENIDLLNNKLKNINYNLLNLKELTQQDLLQIILNGNDNTEQIIINNKYYI